MFAPLAVALSSHVSAEPIGTPNLHGLAKFLFSPSRWYGNQVFQTRVALLRKRGRCSTTKPRGKKIHYYLRSCMRDDGDDAQEKLKITHKQPLPYNWEAVWDDKSKAFYYWNVETNEVRWEAPADEAPLETEPVASELDLLTPEGAKSARFLRARQAKLSEWFRFSKLDPLTECPLRIQRPRLLELAAGRSSVNPALRNMSWKSQPTIVSADITPPTLNKTSSLDEFKAINNRKLLEFALAHSENESKSKKNSFHVIYARQMLCTCNCASTFGFYRTTCGGIVIEKEGVSRFVRALSVLLSTEEGVAIFDQPSCLSFGLEALIREASTDYGLYFYNLHDLEGWSWKSREIPRQKYIFSKTPLEEDLGDLNGEQRITTIDGLGSVSHYLDSLRDRTSEEWLPLLVLYLLDFLLLYFVAGLDLGLAFSLNLALCEIWYGYYTNIQLRKVDERIDVAVDRRSQKSPLLKLKPID